MKSEKPFEFFALVIRRVLVVLLSFGFCLHLPLGTPSFAATVSTKLGFHTTKAKGEQKGIVVLVNFPDVARRYPINRLSERITGFLGPYFKEASYNNLLLKIDVTKPYTLPKPVSYYKISPRNVEVDNSKIIALVTDAVNAADGDVDFNDYTYVILALGATHREYGMVGLCPIPGMLGFQTTSITTKSGEIITNAAIFCENAHLGTYVHDTLHMLGGRINKQRLTPCLYDHGLQAKYPHIPEFAKAMINMGFWDPLSSHAPYRYELQQPTGLSSWTKMRLNWIAEDKIALVPAGQTATVKLDPLTDPKASTLVIKIPITDNNFYLVENRQKIGQDTNCPTSGILILYADDSVYECHKGKAPVKIMDANPSVPYLNDATFEIGKKDRYIDERNNIAIILQKKEGNSYQILITTADKAD
jgi:M6 family metalloprotease-like protein